MGKDTLLEKHADLAANTSSKRKESSIKARYWVAVLYPENMLPDWEEKIGDLIQVPYAYCIHNRDRDKKSEHRKDHVHLIIVFNNTTPKTHAMNVFDRLSAPGKRALNTCEQVINIRHMYDYLIHDTETCKKQDKELYDPSERIEGNGFDIGLYEQIGEREKLEIYIELSQLIIDKRFSNYADFCSYVFLNFKEVHYIEILKSNSAHFERLTKGVYQSIYLFERTNELPKLSDELQEVYNSDDDLSESNQSVLSENSRGYEGHSSIQEVNSGEENSSESNQRGYGVDMEQHAISTRGYGEKSNCCPFCKSNNFVRRGWTPAGTQRFLCKECKKTFVLEDDDGN